MPQPRQTDACFSQNLTENPGLLHERFVVDKLAMGQVFLYVPSLFS
jgi:hypothetical protein